MKVYILGSAGIPARYGGFETFAENIASLLAQEFEIHVACSKRLYNRPERNKKDRNIYRFFIPFNANGYQSFCYDLVSLLFACIKSDFIIFLGTGSGLAVAIFKTFFRTPIAIHIDGLEWKRKKWNRLTRFYLWLNTRLCFKSANYLLVDNKALNKYIPLKYANKIRPISYGCGHLPDIANPKYIHNNPFALSIARAEPENNLHLIIEAFQSLPSLDLIIISNYADTAYGKMLRKKYSEIKNVIFYDPIYDDKVKLQQYRLACKVYIHGHSVGGTNPSLIEAMTSGNPIIAFDNDFNRITTNNLALYFKDSDELQKHLINLNIQNNKVSGSGLKDFALKNYRWEEVTGQLSEMINSTLTDL